MTLVTSRATRPAVAVKTSFVGMPAVGKTTLLKMLTGKRVDGRYVPTQGFDLGRTQFKDLLIRAWDFGGQKAFLKQYLSQYIFGSDLVFVVTDSTPKNVLSTKELIEFIRNVLGSEDYQIVAIANKQDLPGHMSPSRVEDVLQVPTYGTVATSRECKDALLDIIHAELDRFMDRKGLNAEEAVLV